MRKDNRLADAPAVDVADLSLSVFGAKEIRDVLKNKAYCLHAGFPPDHIVITTFNEIRNHYLGRVGLPTYLSQMLGNLSSADIERCRLYSEDWHPIELRLNGNGSPSVQRFIAEHFELDGLPFKVEVCQEARPSEVEVRYV